MKGSCCGTDYSKNMREAIAKANDMPFEYAKITEYIYIGTNKCCKEGWFIQKLLKEGIKVALCSGIDSSLVQMTILRYGS